MQEDIQSLALTGIIAGEVNIPVSDAETPACRAMPSKGSTSSVMLVVLNFPQASSNNYGAV
jgi:hypothetical protein